MLPALHDDDRRALARLATMLIIGALSVLPVTTQSSSVAGAAGVRDVTNDANLMVPAHLTFPAYEISRDPFVPAGPMRTKLDGNATTMSVGQGGDIGVVLPPNAGASQSGARPGVPTGMTMARFCVLSFSEIRRVRSSKRAELCASWALAITSASLRLSASRRAMSRCQTAPR